MSYQQTKHQLWIDRVSIPADNGMANWTWHRCYVQGFRQPNYPVPAEIISFDYWSAEMTDSGKPALYGHRLYKPGRWLEFLAVE